MSTASCSSMRSERMGPCCERPAPTHLATLAAALCNPSLCGALKAEGSGLTGEPPSTSVPADRRVKPDGGMIGAPGRCRCMAMREDAWRMREDAGQSPPGNQIRQQCAWGNMTMPARAPTGSQGLRGLQGTCRGSVDRMLGMLC